MLFIYPSLPGAQGHSVSEFKSNIACILGKGKRQYSDIEGTDDTEREKNKLMEMN